MAQFDVYRIGDGGLVVDLQSDLIAYNTSRFVAPVFPLDDLPALPILTPIVRGGDTNYRVHMMEAFAVPSGVLGQPLFDMAHARDDLFRALDFLTRGF